MGNITLRFVNRHYPNPLEIKALWDYHRTEKKPAHALYILSVWLT